MHSRLIETMNSEANKLQNPANKTQLDKLIAYPEQAVEIDGRLYVFPKFRGQYVRVLAKDYWPSIGIPQEAIDKLLDAEGKWIYRVPLEQFMNAMSGSAQDFSEYLYHVYEPIYKPVQPMLNASGGYPGVFNDHTLERHILRLQMIANHVRIPNLPQFEVNMLATAITGHDSGSPHRTSHSYLAEVIHLLVLGEKILDDEYFTQILLAMRHHDERVSLPIIEDIKEEAHALKNVSSQERSQFFLERFSRWFSVFDSLMRLIDKLDNGQSRLPNQAEIDEDIINGDSHISCNSLFKMGNLEDHIQYSGDTFRYTLHLALSPDQEFISPKNIETYVRPETGETRIKIAKSMRDAFLQYGISYFESNTELFGQLYHERILLIALDSFNSSPDVNKVVVKFMDPARHYELSKTHETIFVPPIVLTFHRDSILEEMELLKAVGEKKLTMKELAVHLKSYDSTPKA